MTSEAFWVDFKKEFKPRKNIFIFLNLPVHNAVDVLIKIFIILVLIAPPQWAAENTHFIKYPGMDTLFQSWVSTYFQKSNSIHLNDFHSVQ